MRHRETAIALDEVEADVDVKNEYSIDIKDEDLEAFGLELPIDVESFRDVCVKGEHLQDQFCDNDDSLIDENEYSSTSPATRHSLLIRRRRKPLQPQRAKQSNYPLATFPTRHETNSKDIKQLNDQPRHEDDASDDSQNEFKDIEQELEEEMVSDDEEDARNSPDTEEHISQFSNTTTIADEEFADDGNEEPPDLETNDVFKGLREEVDELDEKTQKSVEEEWYANWGVKCNMCTEVFAMKVDFEDHYRNTYQLNPVYTCSYCDKTMNTYSTFRSHCYRHICEKRFKCPICSKGFSLRSILQGHIVARHTDLKPFICEECGKGFVTRAGLNIHLRKHRTNQKEDFPCIICGKTLHTRGGLTAHMNVHRLGRRFMCDICGKTFTQKVNMRQHVKQHTGERPFTCDQCGKSFAEKSHLARHHSFHSDTRPFECTICKKMYKTERCLKVHRLVHAVSRPHVCVYCNKGFLSSTKLKQHHNIHTGERPFKCKYCERTFTNYPNWLKHTRRRHKVDHKTGVCLVPKQETIDPAFSPNQQLPESPNQVLPSAEQTVPPETDQLSNLLQMNPEMISQTLELSQSEQQLDLTVGLVDNSLADFVCQKTELISEIASPQPTQILAVPPEHLVNTSTLAATYSADQLFIDYTKLSEGLLTAAATAVQFAPGTTLGDETKLNMQTQLFPTQFEVLTNSGYANMSFMLPYQQHTATSILEPLPAHQNQIIFQSTTLEEPHPAHQQQQLIYPPQAVTTSGEHVHFLHTQQMLQM